MNESLLYIVLILLFLMNLKWIAIILIFPSQVADVKRNRIKEETGKRVLLLYVFAAPYVLLERHLMNDGWQRFMMYQIGLLPSLHLRKWIYKCLGVTIGHDVVIHFRTEIRAPRRLFIGGDNCR